MCHVDIVGARLEIIPVELDPPDVFQSILHTLDPPLYVYNSSELLLL